MKRGKGICAAVLMGLVGGMTGAVVSASADAGGRGQAASSSRVAVVADAAPTAQSSDPGNTRGGGGSDGGSGGGTRGGGGGGSDSGTSSQVAQVGSGGGGGNGNSQGGGAGGNPQGGTGGRDGGSSPGSSGSSGSGGSGSERSQSGSGSGSGGSGGSQGSGAAPGRSNGSNAGGNGNGNGNSGGNGGGSSIGGQSGRCSSGCHVSQQPGTAGTPSFTPVPSQKTPSTTPVTPPVTTPVTPPTGGKPKHGLPTSTTYSTSATPIRSNRNSATGLVGLGTTVSPALGAGTVATGSALPTASQGAIANLIGGTPAIQSSTHSGYRRSAAPTRPATITQPVAQQTFIGSIEQVVPPVIWLALAAALAVGGLSAGWAVYSGHRVRRQAGALAAMSTAALTDQLTGVLNRRGFLEAVERELARAKRYDRGFVLAYVDVRGLKGVNDTEGHRAGDELLKEAASLLQDSARADDVVGRLGGDEMGLLLVEQGAEGADAVRRRVAAQVPDRREKLGLHSSWDLTIGTAAYPEDGETVDDLLRVADLRLYEQRGIDLLDRAPA